MIKLRALRENESLIAPTSWVSEKNGSECGVFLMVTKTQDDSDADYSIAGDHWQVYLFNIA